MSYEQLREQCAELMDEIGSKLQTDDKTNDYWMGVGAMVDAAEIAIHALPAPEVNHETARKEFEKWVVNQGVAMDYRGDGIYGNPTVRRWYEGFIAATELGLCRKASTEALQKEINRLSNVEFAFDEWIEKTNWVQLTRNAQDLGKHRADVLRERIESAQKENEQLQSKIQKIQKLLSDDGYAISFQSLGQYRSALIKELKGSAQCRCKELRDFCNGEHHPLCKKGGAA